ncbi:MAG: box helicase domain protein, partial [Mycobacterium sp.]|nr:box helicase domain protein [Mycobacterium sp.]
LALFSSGEARVLVATDIAARGVHVDDVELVVHVDPPMEHKAYLHRSGRTARAGSSGDVVTVVLPEQRKDTQALLRMAGISVKPQEVAPDSAPVQALVGEVAAYRAPAPQVAQAPQQDRNRRPSTGSRRGGHTGGQGAARTGGSGASSRGRRGGTGGRAQHGGRDGARTR